MSTIEQVLRQEIARIARREVRRALREVEAVLRRQRRMIQMLRRASRGRVEGKEKGTVRIPGVTEEEVEKSRFSGKLIRKLRLRLGLSRRELAQLVGASPFAVIGWESDKFRPRGEKRLALVALRRMGVRAVRKLLADGKRIVDVGGGAGK